MEAITIIMTNCISWSGIHYITFEEKGTGIMVGEIDREDGKYRIFGPRAGRLHIIGSRTSKDSAIKMLQRDIQSGYGEEQPLKFRKNVIQIKEKICRNH